VEVVVVARPLLPVSVRREFWLGIRRGLSVEAAGLAVGVSPGTGRRWFLDGGGMPNVSLAEPSGRFLSDAERSFIEMALDAGFSPRQIAKQLGRASSTIRREIKRGRQRQWPFKYIAANAQSRAQRRSRRPKQRKLTARPGLRRLVIEHLCGPHHLSPEQISHRLRMDFPDDEQMHVSHETIYRSLFVQGKGGLRRDLTKCLRTGRAVRKPRGTTSGRGSRIRDMVMISERPAEVEDRAVPGHWEGDLIVGENNGSAIGTLVERSTRFLLPLYLPGDHTAPTVREAIVNAISTLPEVLRKTLTWDQGVEMAEHAQIAIDAGIDIYFCDPHSPWQRGTNENTNGLFRQYFPKGTDLSVHTPDDIAAAAAGLNGRIRKTLGWKTPLEAFNELLSIHNKSIDGATTR
jgi:IS30 family transposase